MLSGSRSYTMGGAGPIPLSEIKACLDLLDITDPDDIADYIYIIKHVDAAFLEWTSSAKPTPKKGQKPQE